MKVSHEVFNQTAVITVTGELVADDLSAFEQTLQSCLDSGCYDFMIECADLTFADSAGLEKLLWLQDEIDSKLGSIRFDRPSESFHKVLEMVRFDHIFEILDESGMPENPGGIPRGHSMMPHGPREKRKIDQVLMSRGWVTQEQIDRVLEYQRNSTERKLFGEILVELDFCSENQVLEALAGSYEVPFAMITPKLADAATIEVLARDFIEEHNVMPLFLIRNRLTIAVTEASNLFLVEEIQRTTGLEVQIVVSPDQEIRTTRASYQANLKAFVIDDIVDDLETEDFQVVDKQVMEIDNIEEMSGDSPVIKLVNYVIYSAVQEGASDIHIEPDDGELRVRYRVDGKMFEKAKPPFSLAAAIASRIKIMSNLDISERRIPQDGGIHVMLGGQPVDLRVSTMPGPFGEKVVIRVADNRSGLLTLEQLGFDDVLLSQMRRITTQPNGIMLVTGPTGSGKSTTLYSVLSEIANPEINVCTVEDPIEFNLKNVNQFQMNEKAGFTFASALRALLRQDPDVIMVGEVRDGETARIAIQAALTGHMVLSTLHTNDAPSAITRLYNIGVEPYLISATIRGVLAQRLVRKICIHCKEVYDPATGIRQTVEQELGEVDTFYYGPGCVRCRQRGFSGRIGLFELLAPDDVMLDAISRGANLNDLRSLAHQTDFRTLRRDGLLKVRSGMTTYDEVLNVTTI